MLTAMFVSLGKQPSVSSERRLSILLGAAKEISLRAHNAALLRSPNVFDRRAWTSDVGRCHQQTPAWSKRKGDFDAFHANA
jgi:hypothetical protein